MKKTKIFSILHSLSKSEWKDLGKAVRSPIMGGSQPLTILYEMIQDPSFDWQDTLEFRQAVFKKAYPGKPFRDGTIRKLYTFLKEVVEEMLSFRQFKQEKLQQQQLIARAYQAHGFTSIAHNMLSSIEEAWEAIPAPGIQQLRDQMIFAKLQVYASSNSAELTAKRLQIFLQQLYQYFLAEYALALTNSKTLERTLGSLSVIPENLLSDDAIEKVIEKGPFNLRMYYQLAHMVEKNDEQLFQQLQKQFWESIDLLSTDDKNLFFTHFTNFCIVQRNNGKTHFNQQLFALYQQGVQTEIIFDSNREIRKVTFNNTITAALAVGDTAWAQLFIEKYSARLATKYGKATKTLAIANILFHEEKYSEIIKLLSNVKYHDLNEILTAKIQVIRAAYELSLQDITYLQFTENKIIAFKTYLRRKKIASVKSTRYLNTIEYIQKLLSIQQNESINKKHMLSQLTKQIERHSPLLAKQWLLDKVITLS